jgi:hypothetical protein
MEANRARNQSGRRNEPLKTKEIKMSKIKVLDKAIEVPEEIYFLLKKEAEDEFDWDFQQFIDVNLGLKWQKHFSGTEKTYTAEDILKIDARDLACKYWIELEKRGDDDDFPEVKDLEKENAAGVDETGHIEGADRFKLEDLKKGFEQHKEHLGNLETLLYEFSGLHLESKNNQIKSFLADFNNLLLDDELEGFCLQFPFSTREAFYFLAGLHSGIEYQIEKK